MSPQRHRNRQQGLSVGTGSITTDNTPEALAGSSSPLLSAPPLDAVVNMQKAQEGTRRRLFCVRVQAQMGSLSPAVLSFSRPPALPVRNT
eukprot:4960049-Amphidinium_carterae.2